MIEKDEEIEDRIMMEVIVDAYDEEERAMGWYYYVGNNLAFPFEAKCIAKAPTSPLKVGKKVTVVDIADAETCSSRIFVNIEYSGDVLAVPLSQLEITEDIPDSKTIINDWHYWVKRGYGF